MCSQPYTCLSTNSPLFCGKKKKNPNHLCWSVTTALKASDKRKYKLYQGENNERKAVERARLTCCCSITVLAVTISLLLRRYVRATATVLLAFFIERKLRKKTVPWTQLCLQQIKNSACLPKFKINSYPLRCMLMNNSVDCVFMGLMFREMIMKEWCTCAFPVYSQHTHQYYTVLFLNLKATT